MTRIFILNVKNSLFCVANILKISILKNSNMEEPIYFNEEFKAQWKYAMEQAKADREKYFNWIKDEINIAISLINKYDKIYVLVK